MSTAVLRTKRGNPAVPPGWRRARFDALKQTPEYTGLAPVLQRVVRYMVMHYDNPVRGMFVGQAKLAERFDPARPVTRQTMNEYLGEIVRAGIFCEPETRGRKGRGSRGGRTTNTYRLNESLLPHPDTTPDTSADITPDSTPDSGSTYLGTYVFEALPQESALKSLEGHVEETTLDNDAPSPNGSGNFDSMSTPVATSRDLEEIKASVKAEAAYKRELRESRQPTDLGIHVAQGGNA